MSEGPPASDVTVAITNWNGRAYLEDCIAGVLAQTLRPARILLIDNASDDDGPAFVRARFPEVEIVVLPRNDGPCPARNAALSRATTPWVLSIDNDAVLAPDCLERLLAHVDDRRVACVQPRAVFAAEPTRVHYDGADMHYVGIMTLRDFYRPLAEAASAPSSLGAAISVALLLRRDAALAVGAYDARHFILFEDHDFSYRLRARGHLVVHEPAALVHHKEGTAGISFREKGAYTPRRVFLHARNRWIVLFKCHAARTLWLGLPGILAYDVAYLVFAMKSRCLGAWLQGKIAFLKLVPGLLADRREVQRHRVVRDRDLLGAGSLTISPLIERGGLLARCQRGLDRFLAFWWRLVRRWC